MVLLTEELQEEAASRPNEPRPLVRLGFGAVAVVAAAGIAARIGADIDLLAALAFVAVAGAISIIDMEQFRVPNRLVLPAAVGALAWQAAFHRGDLVECVVAGAGAALFFLLSVVLSRGAVGMGDVKFALLMGILLGRDVITGIFVATLAGGVAGGIVLWRKGRAGRRTPIPYVPFLAAGAVIALLVGSASPLV